MHGRGDRAGRGAALLEDGSTFLIRELAPSPRRELAEGEVAHAHADEAQRRMTDRCGHASDLAVFALDEFERKPAIGNVFAKTNRRVAGRKRWRWIETANAARTRGVVADPQAAFEFCERGVVGESFDLRPIFAAMSALGIEQLGIQAGLVTEEQQAFGIGVETSERVNIFR